MSQTLEDFIGDYIRKHVATAGTQTRYRPVLVGIAAADDPAWAELRQIADPNHGLPCDLLSGAASVVAFFIPFHESVVRSNRGGQAPSTEWTLAYRETNDLINQILRELPGVLASDWGVRAAAALATSNFDPVTLSCTWSHKSAAAIAGLGSFGLNQLLITDAGCAGRCGSLVLDAPLAPTSHAAPLPHVVQERCRHFLDGKCTYCIDACPAGALHASSAGQPILDKQACWSHLQRVSPDYCCGKCATGPCALRSGVRRAG